jgi:endonuclease/exonuclease/phosphatase family metal-dependent hydrolase
MNVVRTWLGLSLLLLVAAGCHVPPRESPKASAVPTVKVMTFNIRYGTAKDGEFHWPARRELVMEVIRREQPDVLAIQEGLAFQLDEIAPVLADYEKYGQHRGGGMSGEFSGVYVRNNTFEVVDSGEFWLSPTPEVVSSKGWDAALPRMAAWVELSFTNGERMRVYGTHFDHRGAEARLNSALLLVEQAHDGPPSVFTGDFNAEPGSPPIEAFAAAGYRSALLVCDPINTLGTFHGFQDPQPLRRIDDVFCSPGLQPISARILDERVEGIWPSDHFPVVATVQLGDQL